MKKSLRMKFMFLLFALVVGCLNVWADEYELYSGTITEGDYVIVYSGGAMNNTVSSNRLQITDVTITNNKISNPAAAIVWHIAASGDYWTIYNANVSKYAAGTGTKSQAGLLASGTDDKSLWTVTGTSTYNFVNKYNNSNSVNAYLRRNTTYGFACYASGTGGSLSLYKKVEAAGAATTVTIDDSELTNTNKFFGTEAGTLTATVTVTSTSALVGTTVTWSSSDEDVAAVGASDGVVTLVGEGSTTITASYAGETGVYKSSYAEYVLNVTNESPCTFTLWSEDFGTYSEGDKPSGGTYSYTCVDGSTNTQIYNANNAGGTAPELLVNKNGGTFQATIPLNNIEGSLKLQFKSNAYAVTVSTSTEGISISGVASFNASGEHTVTFTGVTTSTPSISIKFAAGSSNVRIDDIELKGAIPVNSDHEMTADFTIPVGTAYNITSTSAIVIPNGRTLTVNGTLTNTTASNLVIEDGGQLITTSTGVKATVKKIITPSVAKTSDSWYAISSPIKDQVISTAVSGTHNVYRYDEENIEWEEYRNASNSFSTFENGRGYLYRSTDGNIIFSEVLNAADVEYTLSYACGNNTYKGFNLIGNPYSHVIYKGATGTAIPNGSILEDKYCVLNTDGTWTLTNDGTAIPSGTAILVQAKSASTLTIENTTSTGSKGRVNNDNIWFTIKNGDYSDAACIEFKEGHGFNKIVHYNENAPMLYINHNGENFASVDMSYDTKAINLNFKAATMGKYTLSLKANGNFNYLHLIDKLIGEDVDMLLNDEYSFIGTPGDDNNRFIVRLSYTPDSDDNSIFAYQSGSDIVVNGAGELQIFDVMGRFVMSEHINGVQTIHVPSQGVYIFRLIGTEVKTQKIVVR